MAEENQNPNDAPNIPAPEPAPSPNPKRQSAASIVGDDSSKTIRKLQEQIADLQNDRDTWKGEKEELLNKFNSLSKVPSKTPGKSLWDEVSEVMGFKK